MELTHINSAGNAFMVDVSSKKIVRRTASAFGKIILQNATIDLVKTNLMKKGDVLAVAKIAGIMAAKKNRRTDPFMSLLKSRTRRH